MTRLDENEKMSLREFAVLHDHALLKPLFDRFDRLGLIAENAELSDLYKRMQQCQEIQLFLELKMKVDMRHNPTLFSANHLEKPLVYFIFLKQSFINVESLEVSETPKPGHK